MHPTEPIAATFAGAGFVPPRDCRIPLRQSLGADALDQALGGGLPRGTLHEILAAEAGDLGAAHGFALALASRLAGTDGRLLLVQDDHVAREDGTLYGPGLAMHGLDPDRLLWVRVGETRLALWAMEQALRCRALSAVIAEVPGRPQIYDLTASRRLILAAREGGATGLLVHATIGGHPGRGSSAAATRWLVRSRPSRPGRAGEPGAPAWEISITRNRNGLEGTWSVEWNHDLRAFTHLDAAAGPSSEALSGPAPADLGDGSAAPYPLRPLRA